MRFRVVISDPWELTSDECPTVIVGDGVPDDDGFVLTLDPGTVLGGDVVTEAHMRLRHRGTSFAQMRADDLPSVNGTAVGPAHEVRFIGRIEQE
ncbi:MAG: hypothetical protein M3256_19775 [Actinomycetota bacterium]|nr:hypothetical protein [Actinomycetota bacterium]